jgi:hypothetical protein
LELLTENLVMKLCNGKDLTEKEVTKLITPAITTAANITWDDKKLTPPYEYGPFMSYSVTTETKGPPETPPKVKLNPEVTPKKKPK